MAVTVLGRCRSALSGCLEGRARRLTTALGLGALASVTLLGARAAAAQQPPASPRAPNAPGTNPRTRIVPPWRMSVRADNDAFNFWIPVTQRPDQEYTNGDQVTVEFSSAPWWGKRFAKRASPCTGTEPAGGRCLTTAISIAQDMYTPRPEHEPGVVPDWRNERPYAALLYATAEARVVREQSLATVGVLLGVTGAPAFGEFAQRTAHRLSGVYSRQPIGWDTEVGFEPAIMVSARTTHWYAAHTGSGNAVVDFTPQLGASLGNVLTEGEGGFQTRVGFHLSNPWWTAAWQSRPPIELYLLGGVRGEAVAHNVTLDGNTLGADRRVDRVPLVGEYTVGIGGRFHGLVAEWRAVTRSKEYRTGPTAHAYSQLFASYEVAARGPR